MNANVKKKTTVGIAVAAVGAAVIALSAGTFAAFSDTQEGPKTTLAAGTLEFGQSINKDVELTDFVPGGPALSRTLTYTNASPSLPGSITLDFGLDSLLENGCNGDEKDHDATCADQADLGELQNKLQVVISDESERSLYTGSLANLKTIKTLELGAGKTMTYTLVFSFPNGGAEDNAAQGDWVTLLTKATLEQPIRGAV